jgi:hypothetical protein
MADEAVLAIEDIPTVTALGLSVLELELVEGLDTFVAELGPPAAVGGEGGDGEEDASVSGELVCFLLPQSRTRRDPHSSVARSRLARAGEVVAITYASSQQYITFT